MDYLYFVVRTDVGIGRAMAQAIHAMDIWAEAHGPHLGAVVVYEVPDEETLMRAIPRSGRTELWREPDFNDAATAFATDKGRLKLPLLGSKGKKHPKPKKPT